MELASFNPKKRPSKKPSPFFFILILLIIQIKLSNSSSCSASDKFTNANCFNDIIKINNKKYRAGKINTNKNNEVIIEYSDDTPGDSRLFYSLKENGRGFYENEEVRKEITLTSDQYLYFKPHDRNYHIVGRYECINDWVYLKDDTDKTKQYLFSISSFASLTELHDIENDSYQQWVTTDFLNIKNRTRFVFSYRFSLVEWADTNVYLLAYIQYKDTNNENKDYSVSYSLSRFYFEKDAHDKIVVKNLNYTEIDNNYDNRIVSAVYVDKFKFFVVCFAKNNPFKIVIRIYNKELVQDKEFEIEGKMSNGRPGDGAFFKMVHCQYEYLGFMYYKNGDDGKSLILRFDKLRYKDDNDKDTDLNLKNMMYYEGFNDVGFKTDITLNDFYKIHPDRYIFAGTTDFTKLYIYLIQQTNWYEYIKIKKFNFELKTDTHNVKFAKEFSFGLYKGFLVFTSTVCTNSDILRVTFPLI